jgi:hypothetical protein
LAFGTTTDSFPVGFVFNSPAALNNLDASALQENIQDATGGTIQFFKNPTAIFDAANPNNGVLRNPRHGEIGNRNVLRGPGFYNLDTAVVKNFNLRPDGATRLVFRWEMYNAFNHNAFALPATNISLPTFGQITQTATTPREMQFALRLQF